MKKMIFITYFLVFTGVWLLTQCSEAPAEKEVVQAGLNPLEQASVLPTMTTEEQLKLGEHLVLIAGCHDCHTPKKMTERGPEPDFSLALSGHPANMPPPDVDRKDIESKGLAVTQTLTSWVGPWGISYSANLTSDATGIGNWEEKNFMLAMREGKFKGLESARTLLPPMPWEMLQNMTDDELKAIFAYLKSTKPIENVVPAPAPPVSAAPGQ